MKTLLFFILFIFLFNIDKLSAFYVENVSAYKLSLGVSSGNWVPLAPSQRISLKKSDYPIYILYEESNPLNIVKPGCDSISAAGDPYEGYSVVLHHVNWCPFSK